MGSAARQLEVGSGMLQCGCQAGRVQNAPPLEPPRPACPGSTPPCLTCPAAAGGFISGGRRQARPVVERKRSNKMGKSGEHAVVGAPPLPPAAPVLRTPNAGGGRKGRPTSADASVSTSTPGTGAVVWLLQ